MNYRELVAFDENTEELVCPPDLVGSVLLEFSLVAVSGVVEVDGLIDVLSGVRTTRVKRVRSCEIALALFCWQSRPSLVNFDRKPGYDAWVAVLASDRVLDSFNSGSD